jgi:hypothetical protein
MAWEESATPSLSVAARGKAADGDGLTPTGLLDCHAACFATPLEEDDDTPRSDAAGGAWSADGSPEREVRPERAASEPWAVLGETTGGPDAPRCTARSWVRARSSTSSTWSRRR